MDRYRVTDGAGFRLADWDPGATSGIAGKAEGRALVAELTPRLDELQQLLYADGRHRLLVVLQGIDTAGKGGAIKRVFRGMNPSGVRVTSFKAPTGPELAHDFLWRVHPHVPGDGEVALFDRSHYEDVLIVRVHDLVPKARWKARYEHIRAFEQMLVDEGTTIRKFFLHISKDEQRKRLEARLRDPRKRWKFRREDLDERSYWDAYQAAYEEMIQRTATPDAPWYVVPSDRKWHRDLVICRALVDTLERLDLSFPQPEEDLDDVVVT
ncbi:MAG TPA: polyphosphate kinase 2 family protein [Acidimicrobiales bacterium]